MAWSIPAAVATAIAPDTILVSIQHANQEIGTVQDIAGHRERSAGRRRCCSTPTPRTPSPGFPWT